MCLLFYILAISDKICDEISRTWSCDHVFCNTHFVHRVFVISNKVQETFYLMTQHVWNSFQKTIIIFSFLIFSIQSSKTAADTALVIDLGMYNGSYEHPYFFQNFVTNNNSDLNVVERISGIQEIINESTTFMDLIRYYGEKISPLAIYNVNQSVE